MRSSEKKWGFTLIELVLVISIIALLVAMVTYNTNLARVRSRDNKRKADLALVAGALELYYAQNKAYPCAPNFVWDQLKNILVPTYLSTFPSDPRFPDGKYGGGYVYASDPCSGLAAGQFVVDGTLEGSDAKPTISISNPQDDTKTDFFQTGIYRDSASGKFHTRTSS